MTSMPKSGEAEANESLHALSGTNQHVEQRIEHFKDITLDPEQSQTHI